MISWMQRHKKWLVITIWISTIAFVGAGFVGWGSYDYGKQGGVVAVVGDREVSVEEYQQDYSNLYDQYSRAFGTLFNQEMADKMNLKDIAYNQTIQKNLILSYADSLGLDITNEDVAKQLVKYEAFLKDGKFDKETYVKVLNQNRTTPAKFEEGLKRDLLLQKVQKLFNVEPNGVEIENLSKLLFVQDDIEYKVISLNDVNVEVKDEDLKKYWEEHKDSYKSEVSYDLQTAKVPVVTSNSIDADIASHYDKFKLDYKKEDGKIKTLEEAKADIIKDLDEKASKTEALKEMLKYKKGEKEFTTTESFLVSKLPFAKEENDEIKASAEGTLLKPFLVNNEFVIVKIAKKNAAQTLSYEDALSEVKKDFTEVAKAKKLDEMAAEQVKTFTGKTANGVTRESIDKISDLSQQEAAQFLSQLFATPAKEGVINLEGKVVLYKITDSKLGQYDSSKDEMVKQTLVQIQDQELMANLIKRLELQFEIQSSIQTKDQ